VSAARRKFASACYTLCRAIAWKTRRLAVLLRCDGCRIHPTARIARGALIQVTDGGRLHIGAHVFLGANVQLIARGGSVRLGDDTFVGPGSVIVAQASIDIGRDCLIGEYVTIRDQDHAVDGGDPIRTAGFLTAPVRIGDNVWLGAKSSVLRGSEIGDGAAVGAHALVSGRLQANCVARGVPAQSVRTRAGARGGGPDPSVHASEEW